METTGFLYLAPLLVFFPVIGLLINLIFGGRFSEKAIGWIASAASGAAFVVSRAAGVLALCQSRRDHALDARRVDPYRRLCNSTGPSASTRSRPR